MQLFLGQFFFLRFEFVRHNDFIDSLACRLLSRMLLDVRLVNLIDVCLYVIVNFLHQYELLSQDLQKNDLVQESRLGV